MNSSWIEHLPDWYLTWCHENAALQAWWRTAWESTSDTPVGTNVNVGDRFTLGPSRQACIIYSKTINVGGATGKPDHVSYHIGGDRGGFWYAPRHDDGDLFSGGYAKFIPTAEQLQQLGFGDVAARLLADLVVKGTDRPGCRCLLAYRELRGHHATGCPKFKPAEDGAVHAIE